MNNEKECSPMPAIRQHKVKSRFILKWWLSDTYYHNKSLFKYKIERFISNIGLFIVRRAAKDSNIIYNFRKEVKYLGWDKSDDKMQKLIVRNVEDLLAVVSAQGHSGFSFSYLMSLFNKAANFKPLSRITFNDDEFNDDTLGGDVKQNKRDTRIFKYEDGSYSFNDAIKHTPISRISIDEKTGMMYREKSTGATWHGPIIVIPKNGDAYKISDIRIKDTKEFSAKEFNIGTIEIEYPEGWWLAVCKESDIDEFAKEYSYRTDYEHVKSEINFKDGAHKKDILRLLAEAKRRLYKAKKGHLEAI